MPNCYRFLTALCISYCCTNSSAQVFETTSLITAPAEDDVILFGYFGIAMDQRIIASAATIDDFIVIERPRVVYIFDSESHAYIETLTPEVGNDSNFGNHIRIDGDLLTIGNESSNGDPRFFGSIEIYDVNTREYLRSITSPTPERSDFYARTHSIDQGMLAVSAPRDDGPGHLGSVYVYDANSGEYLHRITPTIAEPGSQGWFNYDTFGFSMDIDQGVLAIGTPGDSFYDIQSGAVYLYDIQSGDLLHKIYPDDPFFFDQFGWSVALDDGLLTVGTPLDHSPTNIGDSGSVYVFDVDTGVQLEKIVPCNSYGFGHFGHSVDIKNGIIAIGAVGDDSNGEHRGAVYLYDMKTRTFLTRLQQPSDVEGGIGAVVRFGHDQLLISGSIGTNISAPGPSLISTDTPCGHDIFPDGQYSFLDYLWFIDQRNDLNCDSVFNFLDVSAFMQKIYECN